MATTASTAVIRQVSEHLRNYVYLLLDPRDGQPFYVGKGRGLRATSHGIEAEEAEGTAAAEASRKIARIRDIRSEGQEPEIWILRYGLGAEYTHVEAAVIDTLSSFGLDMGSANAPMKHSKQLVNARRELNRGHGIETLDGLIAEFSAPDLEHINEPLLLITLKPWIEQEEALPGGGTRRGHGYRLEWLDPKVGETEGEELANSVRCWWRVNQQRMEDLGIAHIVAVFRGVTRALFRIVPGSWERDETTGRKGFEVEAVTSGHLHDQVIGAYGYRVPTKKKGDMSVFNYWEAKS